MAYPMVLYRIGRRDTTVAAKAPSHSSAVMYAAARHPKSVGRPPRDLEKVTMTTNGHDMIPPQAVS